MFLSVLTMIRPFLCIDNFWVIFVKCWHEWLRDVYFLLQMSEKYSLIDLDVIIWTNPKRIHYLTVRIYLFCLFHSTFRDSVYLASRRRSSRTTQNSWKLTIVVYYFTRRWLLNSRGCLRSFEVLHTNPFWWVQRQFRPGFLRNINVSRTFCW